VGDELPEFGTTGKVVVYTAVAVPEESRIRSITISSMQYLKKAVRKFRADTQDCSKKYIHFFPETEYKKLVDNEKRLKVPGSEMLNYDNIFLATDATIMTMVARYLRPTTRDQYNTMFLDGVKMLKSVTKSWKYGIEGYDEQLHAAVNVLVEEVRDVYEMIEAGSAAQERRLWPEPIWGKASNEGLLRLVHALLGRFADNFQAAMSLSKIEKFKSLEEYLTALASINDDRCTEAKKLREMDSSDQPFTKVTELVKRQNQMYEEQMQKRFLSGRHLNSTAQAPNTPIVETRGRFNGTRSANLLGSVEKIHDTAYEEIDQSKVEDDEDESIFKTPINLGAIREPLAGRTIVEPKGSKTMLKEILPCFKYFVNECTGHCEYSHAPKAMEQYRDMLWKKLSNSRFGGMDWVDLQLQAHKGKTPSRTVTGPVGGTSLRALETIEDLGAETLLEDLLCRESLMDSTELHR
jgi:hypothetical protein